MRDRGANPGAEQTIARGRAGPGLLAHIIVSKFDDHLPLYRQAEIYAREGVDLETSTLSGWVGATAAALSPLVEVLRYDVLNDVLHGDDTPVPVLAPGAGKTKTGRLWAYVRDGRPYRGDRPPACVFFYSPDRKGDRPAAHLQNFVGVLHADGYAGFNSLYEGGRIIEAACWAHVRRKFFDVHVANSSAIAKEALDRIGELYGVEADINGMLPEDRRQQRQAQSIPVAEALKAWAEGITPKLSGRSELAGAFRYMLARWPALTRCFDDGRLNLDNNPVERALRGVAVGRRITSLPAPMPAANVPPPCTPLSKLPSSMELIRKPTCVTYSRGLPITQTIVSSSSYPGIGSRRSRSPRQPKGPFAERLRRRFPMEQPTSPRDAGCTVNQHEVARQHDEL